MRFSSAAVLATAVAGVVAEDKYMGFNSGATDDTGKVKTLEDFKTEFKSQQSLKGAPGTFNAVRLYTNVKPGSEDSPEPIEAIPAAIETKTKMLLGMWASGTDNVDKELAALEKAIKTHGKKFTDLVVGISIGSEDLYRISVDGIANKAGVGADIDVLTKFVKDTREKLKNTDLKDTPIGHVDTWNVWDNGTVASFISELDFLGVDLYPYYENGNNIPDLEGGNDIKNAFPLFQYAMDATLKAAGNKPVWITETGWPVTGEKQLQAQPSKENAQEFWQQVGCYYFGKLNTFWYIQRDSNPENTMKFGLAPKLDGEPLYDLSCPKDIKRPDLIGSGKQTTNGTSGGNSTSTSGGNSTSNGNSTGNNSTAPYSNSTAPFSNSTAPYSNSTSPSNNSTGSLTNSGSSNAPNGGSAPNGSPSAPAGSSAGSFLKSNVPALALSMVFAVAAWAL